MYILTVHFMSTVRNSGQYNCRAFISLNVLATNSFICVYLIRL